MCINILEAVQMYQNSGGTAVSVLGANALNSHSVLMDETNCVSFIVFLHTQAVTGCAAAIAAMFGVPIQERLLSLSVCWPFGGLYWSVRVSDSMRSLAAPSFVRTCEFPQQT